MLILIGIYEILNVLDFLYNIYSLLEMLSLEMCWLLYFNPLSMLCFYIIYCVIYLLLFNLLIFYSNLLSYVAITMWVFFSFCYCYCSFFCNIFSIFFLWCSYFSPIFSLVLFPLFSFYLFENQRLSSTVKNSHITVISMLWDIHYIYAFNSPGDSYSDQQLSSNFELWV